MGRAASGRVFHHKTPCTTGKDITHADICVQDFAAARIGVARPDGKADIRPNEPADGGVRRVHVVPVGIIGLLLRKDRILESDLLEGLVPFGDTGLHRRAVPGGNVLVHPVHDRTHGFRQRRCRVLLLQTPALDQVNAGIGLHVSAEVGKGLHEMSQPRIRQSRCHRRLRQGGKVVDIADKETAWIGRGLRRCRARYRWRGQWSGRNAGRGEMHTRRQGAQGRFGARCIKEGIGLVQRVGQSVGGLDARRITGNVGQQEAGIDQDRLALRVLQAEHRCRGQQTGRERLAHGQFGPAHSPELGIECQQLHLVANAPPLGQRIAAHLARIEAAFADRTGNVDSEQKGLVERRLGNFQPDFLILAPDRKQAVLLLGILDHFGKGFGQACVSRSGRRRGRGRWCRRRRR